MMSARVNTSLLICIIRSMILKFILNRKGVMMDIVTSDNNKLLKHNMLIIGHRGVMGEYPQNTLESFAAALDGGLSMIEFDIELSSDGRAIIFHDDTVDKITSNRQHGSINSFSFDELRAMNVDDGKGSDDRTYQIPTLEEVLDLVGERNKDNAYVRVNIELKGANTAVPTADIVKSYLEKTWQPSYFVISSFRHDELVKFKQILQDIEIAMLVDDKQWDEEFQQSSQAAIQKALEMNAIAINPGITFVNQKLVDDAHKAGLAVNVWTINNTDELMQMAKMRVDGVFSNYLNLDKS